VLNIAPAMLRLHILCPTQNKPFATSVECSVEHKPSLPNIIKYSYCPYCQQLHGWTPDEAFFVDVRESSRPGNLKWVKAINGWASDQRAYPLERSTRKNLRRNWRHALPAFIRQLRSTAGVAILRAMSPSENKFSCPTCGAKYEVVRIEAPPGPTTDRAITCVSCGGPLNGREGKFILKYFMIDRARRRASGR
jgi:hypothetical protein